MRRRQDLDDVQSLRAILAGQDLFQAFVFGRDLWLDAFEISGKTPGRPRRTFWLVVDILQCRQANVQKCFDDGLLPNDRMERVL